MSYAQIHQEFKEETISDVKVVLKKQSYGFMNFYSLRTGEIQELKAVERAVEEKNLMADFVLAGVASWDLKNQDKIIVELSKTVLLDLIENYPGFFDKLLTAVIAFNRLADEEKKTLKKP